MFFGGLGRKFCLVVVLVVFWSSLGMAVRLETEERSLG